jgi:hypothetical protein
MPTTDHHDDLTHTETTTMSADQILHPTPAAAAAPTTTPPRRRRRLGLAALATVGLGAGLVPVALSGSGAGAIPVCPQPAVVGCPPDPTEPPPPPPPPSWRVVVRTLMQDTGFTGPVDASRYWLESPVITPDPPISNAPARLAIPPIHFPVTVTPAGTATMEPSGVVKLPVIPMPSGATMALRLAESGSPGSLCRTKPVSPLPASGGGLHLLVPKPVQKSATDLRAMVQSFKGVQTGTPAGTKVNVTATNLVPLSTGVELRLRGRIDVGTALHFNFYYRILLDLNPNNSVTQTGQAMTVAAPNRVGSISLSFIGTPPPNGAAILAQARPQVRDQMRAAVMSKATPAVNASINGIHDVKFWTDQGFTLSIRRVGYSTTGLAVYPSFCMLG